MKAEIITVGDEILIGQIVDTNSAWLAARLEEEGITVTRILTVGDFASEIEEAVNGALSRAELTVVTGGLGPTRDDITKSTLARLFGCGMTLHEETLRRNERMFAARGIPMNELNRSQAMLPQCCTPLPNPNGTAPGMWFERNGRTLVSLPGVPFEMKGIVNDTLVPMLRSRFGPRRIVHRTAITFGLAESSLAERIAPWEDTLPQWLHLAYLPSPSQIRLRLSAYDVDEAEAVGEINRCFAELEKLIPQYVAGYGSDTLASVTAALLKEKGATLAVAESCTGGALSAAFTAVPGASDYFLGGVVAYSNEVKVKTLGVSPQTLERRGAVSEPTALEMAEGVRRLCGSDYALATTGIAGPSGGTPEKPVGTVWIAAAGPQGTLARRVVYGRLRAQNIERFTAAAVNMLRLTLKGLLVE